jgi:hypothetical protein
MRRRSLRTLCALALVLLGVGAADGSARVPQGFAGVDVDSPIWPTAHGVSPRPLLDQMVASGVETVRLQIDWAEVQPYASWATVPAGRRSSFTDVGGLPLSLHALDGFIGECADRGLTVLPLVADAPDWDAIPQPGIVYLHTPRSPLPYAQFLGALVKRYGLHGSFWKGRPRRLPLRTWEVWNEPNLTSYWDHTPFALSYVFLLKTAHDAIKHADPGATVVLGGLANDSWNAVAAILRFPVAGGLFDVVGIHPYTRRPAGVLTILGRARHELDTHGARNKKIVVDEFGWTSSLGHSPNEFGIETTPAGQARNLHQAIGELIGARRRLGLTGFDYYDWAGHEYTGAYEFQFSGLNRFNGHFFVAKPALAVFQRDALAAEGCAAKRFRDALVCARTAAAH